MICFSSGNYLWIVGHPNSLRWLFDACILKVFILLVNMMICKLCVCVRIDTQWVLEFVGDMTQYENISKNNVFTSNRCEAKHLE